MTRLADRHGTAPIRTFMSHPTRSPQKRTTTTIQAPPPATSSISFRAELLGLLALAGLTGYFLWTSWFKWPDPLIDFGRELYLPWRIIHGAVLYRDVDDYYGPLSQYWNAGLFAVFGPGVRVL